MILLNGKLEDSEIINLDSGFSFGRGLFETMHVKDRPLFLQQHLDRINKGLKTIRIGKSISNDEVLDAVRRLQCTDSVLKLMVTERNTLFTTRSSRYTEDHYTRGFSASVSSVRRNETSPLVYLKSLNYLDNILEHEKSLDEGFDEVLFLNTQGFLAEGSLSNIFFIKGNTIYTPSLDCGLLDGIIRKFVIDNFTVIEGRFTEADLMSADSAFLTNSIMGIMKLRALNGRQYDESPIIREIQETYKKECSSQAK
ncbi:aminotransferase class IV [Youngiibacter fragilis]|uniref:4-amino-4-deoxychorismate lyase n=1 Tax=Youngiibacter fragilis 232.1 TaxID=994573 RepID=V7I932_9CLOT|nr:aminotransferase class IV [Youngiibacter fragilis]ETA82348.1 4-amino-4-deoxychorismate lyase [Youngiibacter fragilis 232.1]